MKYGTDNIETNIPVGMFANASTPIINISATNIIIAEQVPLAKNKTRVSTPTSFLAICGPIKPRKKKFPPKATEALLMAIAPIANITKSLLVLTPIPFATSYQIFIALSVYDLLYIAPPKTESQINKIIM